MSTLPNFLQSLAGMLIRQAIRKIVRGGLFLTILLTFFQFRSFSQAAYIDSLKSALDATDNDTMKLKIYSMLGEVYVELKPDSSRYYSELLLALTRKLHYPLKEVYAQGMLGYALINKGDYPRSLKAFLEGYALGQDPSIESFMLPAKYQDDEQFQHHLNDGHLQRLDELANVDLKYGILYENMQDYEKEKELELEGIRLVEETGNASLASACYMILGKAYIKLGMLDSAQIFEETALAKSRQSRYRKYLGTIFLDLGRIQLSRGNLDQAVIYFRQAIDVSLELHYLRGAAAGNLEIASLYLKAGNPDSSLYYANKAFTVSEYVDNPSLMMRSYRAKADAFRKLKKNDSAVKYQQLVFEINDSLFNSKQTQLFKNIDFDAMQRKQELEAAQAAYRNRLENYVMASVIGIFFLLALGLWLNNKQRQKAFGLLQRQKTETEIQKAKAEQALEELKTTQSQLVQREKMASLGELTAGIAHEIQNPLNFVNNFSELNAELIGDLQEDLKAQKFDDALATAGRIRENEEKISHHGNRADAIVKSMLQHSRTGAGHKELTDINALAGEYVKLSYHGFRAKQKDFHLDVKTQFDPELQKVQVVPRDIGSVLLNLLNNAFYAVCEKKKHLADGYEPGVTVSTRQVNGKVEIDVRDNGPGIPPRNLEKIFQPFFTTKPAGQGTGLGLSLSYDIVKAHGGEIKVDTKEGEGTAFTLVLPATAESGYKSPPMHS